MLSQSTVQLLNKVSRESDALYQEGGMLYKYTFGHRCAHTEISGSKDSVVVREVLNAVELFISNATESPDAQVSNPLIRQRAEELMDGLSEDFEEFLGPAVLSEEDDYSKKLTLLYKKENDFHRLELFWSID